MFSNYSKKREAHILLFREPKCVDFCQTIMLFESPFLSQVGFHNILLGKTLLDSSKWLPVADITFEYNSDPQSSLKIPLKLFLN